jgi:hypothetical protein
VRELYSCFFGESGILQICTQPCGISRDALFAALYDQIPALTAEADALHRLLATMIEVVLPEGLKSTYSHLLRSSGGTSTGQPTGKSVAEQVHKALKKDLPASCVSGKDWQKHIFTFVVRHRDACTHTLSRLLCTGRSSNNVYKA